MTLSIIVAMSNNRVIGREGRLPWHIPEDLKRFKQITMGHPIIMGRKTWESIGKPLPGRQNIVITRNQDYDADGITIVHSLAEALNPPFPPLTKGGGGGFNPEEYFVIGGAQIFMEALPLADKIYLTLIEQYVEGDTYFPENTLDKDFDVIEKSPLVISLKEKIPYRFIVLARSLPSAA